MARTALGEFLALVKKNNIARSNRFKITFNIPQKLLAPKGEQGSPGDSGKNFMQSIGDTVKAMKPSSAIDSVNAISLTCMIVDIPGVQENVTEIGYGNYNRRIVHGRTYGDFHTSFLITGKYAEKKLFDTWLGIINDESSKSVEFYDEYISDIIVECLDMQDATVYTFTLTEAFPISVGSIRMDRTAQNQQLILDVAWAFHRITNAEDEREAQKKAGGSGIPPGIVPGVGSGKNRLFPIPGIDQFSEAVQTTVSTVKEFKAQLEGALAVARDVREQIRDAKMAVLDGVKVINGVVKDVKAINNIPNAVKQEVVNVLNDTKNQIGSLKNEVSNFKNYPQR